MLRGIKTVVVGISGGVDSCVAALLLKKKGFNVLGAFMKNWDLNDEIGTCSASQDLEDAKFVCSKLKIPLFELNFVKKYWNEIFTAFITDYENGITPNPDILCNKYIKFHALFNYAIDNLKADALATGHYAKTSFGEFLEDWKPDRTVKLLKARDSIKDQTFFLSQVPQEALQSSMFPLGNLTKCEVRKIACDNGLEKLAMKRESMGLCFIGSRKFQSFISQYITPRPGKFINITTGEVIGTHDGVHLWTVGQRCKIGGLKNALYVVKKNPNTSDIMVAPGSHHPALYSSIFYTTKPCWISEKPDLTYKAELDFKFQHVKPVSPCEIVSIQNNNLIVILKSPLRALTPGQFSVFYKGNECLGSARITNVGPLEYSLGNSVEDSNSSQKC